MCGIVGAVHFERARAVREGDLRAMADRIIHRGPDDHGYHACGHVGIGMRRLSIIDLGGGHQPMFAREGRLSIVFNGELYNYREEAAALRQAGHGLHTQSDTEVVLGLFATQGVASLSRLNGMYGFAVYDEDADRLTLVRDRLGVKPVYYFRDGTQLVFASEIKALLAYPGVQAELDLEMLPVYFKHGYVPAPRTLFRNIFKLPPAHVLEVTAGTVTVRPYWQLSFAHKHAAGEADVLARLGGLLDSAIGMQMVADVPLGAFLSGGLDSSGIVDLMRRSGADSINTYSIGFEAGYAMHDESADAARFAADYGTNHHAILARPDVAGLMPDLIRQLDEPLADSSFVVTYLVAQLAAKSVKVILSGVGGDEIFSGYRRYLFATLDDYAALLPAVVRNRLLPALVRHLPADRGSTLLNVLRLAKRYLEQGGGDGVERYSHYVAVLNAGLVRDFVKAYGGELQDPLAVTMRGTDASAILDKVMYYDLNGSLPEQLLMLTDKMTMATSIEARVPYLDHRLVEFMAATPPSMRLKGFRLRHLQKHYLKGRIPDYVLERRKRGFGAPFGEWVRKDLNAMVNDYLSPARLSRQGLLDPQIAQHALAQHMARKEDHSDFLLANLSFQIWLDAFMT